MSSELVLEEGQILGIANQSLVPDIAAELGSALGTMLGEGSLVVTARDNYPPSRMLKRAFSAGLMSTGVTVMDFHAATTPELVFAIKRLGAKAGIQFTVSPWERDGIAVKIFDTQGIEYSRERIEELVERARSRRIVRSLPTSIGWVTYAEYIHDIYTAAVVSYVDVHAIAGKRFRVVCDTNFGPSSEVLPNLLSEVGVEGILLNSHRPPLRGPVTHMPSPRSVAVLREMVKASDAVVSTVLCADATRVLLIDDEGAPLSSEELLGVLLIGMPAGTRVIVSEAMMTVEDEIAKRTGAKIIRVRGSRHDLVRVARRSGSHLVATCGNEIIFTEFSTAPDGILAMLKTIELLAKTGESLSELRGALPERRLVHSTVRLEGVDYLRLLNRLKMRKIDSYFLTIRGLRVRVGNVWVNVEVDPDALQLSAESVEGADEAVDKLSRELQTLIKETKSSGY
ncbi:MAG: hypothetical protein N3E41_06970 [Thermofilaceae archaeon]|nr:hypothetical protein [Thermofilaceae archaeon]